MSNLPEKTIPAAHNAAGIAEGRPGAQSTKGDSGLPYGVARNANDFRSIRSADKPLTPVASTGLISGTIIQEINVPTMWQMIFEIDERWTDKDFQQFAIGGELKWPEPSGNLSLAPAYISGHTLERNSAGATLTVTAFDALHLLRFGAYSRTFPQKRASDSAADGVANGSANGAGMSDDEIFRELIENFPLPTNPEASPPETQEGSSVTRFQYRGAELNRRPNKFVIQDNETAYDFLSRRCRDAGYEFWIEVDETTGTAGAAPRQTLVVRGTVSAGGGTNIPTPRKPGPLLIFKKDIEKITLDIRVVTLGSSVTALGCDVESEAGTYATCSENLSNDEKGEKETGFEIAKKRLFPDSPMTLRRPDLSDEVSLAYCASAERARRQGVFIEGEATLRTINYQATAGVSVTIDGVNAPFNGEYCVTKSTHRFDGNSNRTVLELRRSGCDIKPQA